MIKRNSILHILLFNLLLFITIYTKNWWIFPLILFYFVWILYEYKWKTILAIFMVIFLSFSFNNKLNKNDITPIKNHTAKIVKIYSSSIVVKEDKQRYYLMGVKENLIVGDTISFDTFYEENTDISSFNLFYRSTKSNGLGYANNLKVISHNKNIRNNIYSSLLEDDSEYSNFTLAMLYKTKTEGNRELLNNINKLGVTHLFVVSGFHISLFYFFIGKVGKKITKNKKAIDFISFGIVLFFLYLVYFPPTGIRALITITIIGFGSLSKIDSLSLAGVGIFIINPYLMVSNSMILSFSITAMIYEISSPKDKDSFLNTAIISTSAFFLSIPTVLTWNSNINIFAPLLTIVLTPIISVSYVICIFILPFHFLWSLFSLYFLVLNKIIVILSILYIPLKIGNINWFLQVYLTIITFIYIKNQKNNKLILLNTFFIIEVLFIII